MGGPRVRAAGWRGDAWSEKLYQVAGLALEALNLARELGGPGTVPLEDCLELGVDHAGERFDHGGRHGLPELGQLSGILVPLSNTDSRPCQASFGASIDYPSVVRPRPSRLPGPPCSQALSPDSLLSSS